MNPLILEIIVNFLKTNPELVGQFVAHLLQQNNVDPKLAQAITQLVDDLVPVLLGGIK